MRLMFMRALTVALAVLGGAAAMAFPKVIMSEAVTEPAQPWTAEQEPNVVTVIRVAPAPERARPTAPRRVTAKPRPNVSTPGRNSLISAPAALASARPVSTGPSHQPTKPWPGTPAPTTPSPAPAPAADPIPTPTPAPQPAPTPAPTPQPTPAPSPTPAPAPAPAEAPAAAPDQPVRILAAVVTEEELAREKARKRERLQAASAAVEEALGLMLSFFAAPPQVEAPSAVESDERQPCDTQDRDNDDAGHGRGDAKGNRDGHDDEES